MKILKSLFLLTAFSVANGAFAEAATIYLKDGSKIYGTVVGATARDVQVHTTDGNLRIDTSRIHRIDYSESESIQAPADTNLPPEPSARRRTESPDNDLEGDSFSIVLGLASPMTKVDLSAAGGETDDNGDPGFLLGAQYLHALDRRWSAGFGVEYFNRSDNDSSALLSFADTAVGGNSVLLLSLFKYSLRDSGAARPYLMAGLGANRTSTEIDAKPLFGFAWSDTNSDETRQLVNDSRWGLASTLRLGVDFITMDPAFFSFEVGWTQLSNSRYPATAAGRDLGLTSVTGDIGAFTVMGRWGWRY